MGVSYYSDEAPVWDSFVTKARFLRSNVALLTRSSPIRLCFQLWARRHLRSDPPGSAFVLQFPRMGTMCRDLIVKTMTRVMIEDPDRQTWLENLHAMRARYLVVFRHEMVDKPIELRYAAEDPRTFAVRYQDEQAVVFEIRD